MAVVLEEVEFDSVIEAAFFHWLDVCSLPSRDPEKVVNISTMELGLPLKCSNSIDFTSIWSACIFTFTSNMKPEDARQLELHDFDGLSQYESAAAGAGAVLARLIFEVSDDSAAVGDANNELADCELVRLGDVGRFKVGDPVVGLPVG